jgi:lipid-A-disaccharide synthase
MVKKEMMVIENTQYEVLKYSTVSVLASGTVTLEAAIMETPAVVTYRVPSLVYHLAKRLIKVPYISLPNLILKEEVYPEFLHGSEVAGEIAKGVLDIFENESKRAHIKKLLSKVKSQLGPKGATWRIAEDVVNYINSLKSSSPDYPKIF